MNDLPARLEAYTAALNRFDMKAVEEMFAENAVYASPGLAQVMVGRDAIMSAFRAYFAQHNDQVNENFDVRLTGAHTIEARWMLKLSHSRRSGKQRIIYDVVGLMVRIEVIDD